MTDMSLGELIFVGLVVAAVIVIAIAVIAVSFTEETMSVPAKKADADSNNNRGLIVRGDLKA